MISQLVRNSMDGKVITIPFYQPKLAKTTFLGKNLYHLVGGAGGSGKSSWIDFNYVLMPYIWYMKNREEYDISLRIIVRSLERNKKHRIAKWVCMYLFNKYNILIDVPNLFGWGQLKSRLTEDIYEKVIEAEEYFEKMTDVVDVVDGVTNPTGLHRYAENYAIKIGDFYVKREVDGKEVVLKKLDYGKYSRLTVNEESLYGNIPHNHLYVEKNPRHITIHITDHIQAMGHEQGLGEKGNLDKHSLYSRELRDLFGFTIVNVSQLNRGIAETSRRISTELYPEDKDFAGSSNMFNDCDMAAILFNPNKYNLEGFEGYETKRFISREGINRFRSIHILKNTYGPDNMIFAYQFIGENGMFRELPNPADLSMDEYNRLANIQSKIKLTNG